jgi:anti-anti-sigma factor
MTQSTATYKFGEKIFLGNADALMIHVDKFFNDESVTTIVFDLDQVRLCDSYGLKFLISCQRKCNTAGKRLLLYRPDSILREMLDNTKLTHFFSLTDQLPSP